VPDCDRKTLLAIIRGRIEPDSIHSDSGAVTVIYLTWDIKSIIMSTMAMTSLQMANDILTALSPSGLI